MCLWSISGQCTLLVWQDYQGDIIPTTEFPMFDDLADINVVITIFALVGGVAQLIFIANFFISMYRGPKATQNPWKSNTLEWTTPVEHIHGNWPGKIPEVHQMGL